MQKKKILITFFITAFFAVNLFLAVNNALSIAPPTVGHSFTCYGYVKDGRGVAVSGATIKIIDPYEGIVRGTTTSSSTGYYSLTVYTNDYENYKVQASKSGYFTSTVYVYSSGSHRVDFTLLSTTPHSFTVEGYVRTKDGKIVAGATVSIKDRDISKTTQTNSQGYYRLVASTIYYYHCPVKVSKNGLYTQTKTAYTSGTHQLDFTMNYIYSVDTPSETIVLGSYAPYPWIYRTYYLTITTTVYRDQFGGGYIGSQTITMTYVNSYIAPAEKTIFTVAYNDGVESYWKAYDPIVYDNSYIRLSSEDTSVSDSFSYFAGEFGQQNTLLKMHVYYTVNSRYVDLCYITYEFLF